MTIVVFLVDTSASMNQRCYLGTSLLDVAKSAIETFLKIRARDPSSRGMDRYMLLTFEDSPNNIKAGWRESQATFQSELRNLKASGQTHLGPALGSALHLLNINRLQSGIDNYGQGRYPHWLEPAVILTFTDGDRLSPTQQVPNPQAISVPKGSSLGTELTLEPFRWDQRIFGIVLRLPGHQPRPPWTPGQLIPSDPGPLDPMCEATGGRSYCLRSHKALNHCLESLASKLQSGIVVSLEKVGPDPLPVKEIKDIKEEPLTNGFPEPKGTNGIDTMPNGLHGEENPLPVVLDEGDRGWELTRRMVFVPRTLHKGYQGFWPLPEAFWPNIQASTLPPRTAHPMLRFTCEAAEPALLQDFPWDKYELEPSPLTLKILARKQPNVVWQVFMEGSGRDANSIVGKGPGLGAPFGYLKPASDLRAVSLFLLPYNYPILLPLIEELRTKLKGKVSGSWRLRFEAYLRQAPAYYYEPLRKALTRISMAHVMPDRNQDLVFSYSVSNYLQRVKYKAKEEFECLVSAIQARAAAAGSNPQGGTIHRGVPLLKPPGLEPSGGWPEDARVFLRQPGPKAVPDAASAFRNPFDIPRSGLLRQLTRMRINLRQELNSRSGPPALGGGLPGSRLSLASAQLLHELPVAHMGSYQEYLSRMPAPLRELEAAPIRMHAFGNPFKLDKSLKNVDEINLDGPSGVAPGMMSPGAPGSPGRTGPKRGDLARRPTHHKRRGLPKGYKYKRRRLDSQTGEVLSDSGWETDTSEASTAPPSPIPPPLRSPPGSPPLKRPKLEPPSPSRLALDTTPPGPSSPPIQLSPVDPGRLFKDKREERKSRAPSASKSKEASDRLSREAIAVARRGIASAVRSGLPTRRKAERLREIWEWGVESAKDRAVLLDFAIQEAGRFKANSLLAILTPARLALDRPP